MEYPPVVPGVGGLLVQRKVQNKCGAERLHLETGLCEVDRLWRRKEPQRQSTGRHRCAGCWQTVTSVGALEEGLPFAHSSSWMHEDRITLLPQQGLLCLTLCGKTTFKEVRPFNPGYNRYIICTLSFKAWPRGTLLSPLTLLLLICFSLHPSINIFHPALPKCCLTWPSLAWFLDWVSRSWWALSESLFR